MSQQSGQIIVAAGSATVTVIGASTAALNAATVIVAVGGLVLLGGIGFGLYNRLSAGNPPSELPGGGAPPLPLRKAKQLR